MGQGRSRLTQQFKHSRPIAFFRGHVVTSGLRRATPEVHERDAIDTILARFADIGSQCRYVVAGISITIQEDYRQQIVRGVRMYVFLGV